MRLVIQTRAPDHGDIARGQWAEQLLDLVLFPGRRGIEEGLPFQHLHFQPALLRQLVDIRFRVRHDGLAVLRLAIFRRDITNQTIPRR